MARKRGAPVASGNDELSDVLAQPGADLPLPTDPVRTAYGEVKVSPEEEEYERLHQPPPLPSTGGHREEDEAAKRHASGEEEQRRAPSQEPPDFEI